MDGHVSLVNPSFVCLCVCVCARVQARVPACVRNGRAGPRAPRIRATFPVSFGMYYLSQWVIWGILMDRNAPFHQPLFLEYFYWAFPLTVCSKPHEPEIHRWITWHYMLLSLVFSSFPFFCSLFAMTMQSFHVHAFSLELERSFKMHVLGFLNIFDLAQIIYFLALYVKQYSHVKCPHDYIWHGMKRSCSWKNKYITQSLTNGNL